MNIRNENDREIIRKAGFKFVTVLPRGENIGRVVSRHRTYDAADKAARGKELAIESV